MFKHNGCIDTCSTKPFKQGPDYDLFYLQILEKDIADLPTAWVEQPDSEADADIIHEYETLQNNFELQHLCAQFERASKYVRKIDEGDSVGDIQSQANKIDDLEHSIGVKQDELEKTKQHQKKMKDKQAKLELAEHEAMQYKSWQDNKKLSDVVESVKKKLGASGKKLVGPPNVK